MCSCEEIHPGIRCRSEDCECHPIPSFVDELTSLINKYSKEQESGTPDFLIANFLVAQLDLYNNAIRHRAEWRDESIELPSLQRLSITVDINKGRIN